MDAKRAAKIFSRARLAQLADGELRFFQEVCKEFLNAQHELHPSEALQLVYSQLKSDYPMEYLVKNEVVKKLFLAKHRDSDATIVSELRAGTSKADCVILNGDSVCFEIKTRFDTTKRLRQQLHDYSLMFGEVYVVFDSAIERQIMKHTEKIFGLIRVDEALDLHLLRPSQLSESAKKPDLLVNALRAQEREYICERLGNPPPQTLSNVDRAAFVRTRLMNLPYDKLHPLFIAAMKQGRPLAREWLSQLPQELSAAATGYAFTKLQKEALRHTFA